MKEYNKDLAKTTAFFTDYNVDRIFHDLIHSLESSGITFEISTKTWKLTYTKAREEEEKEVTQSDLVIREQATIQIELLDAGRNVAGVDIICVEFKRKTGSSMVFYDEFNWLRDEFAHLNNTVL